MNEIDILIFSLQVEKFEGNLLILFDDGTKLIFKNTFDLTWLSTKYQKRKCVKCLITNENNNKVLLHKEFGPILMSRGLKNKYSFYYGRVQRG